MSPVFTFRTRSPSPTGSADQLSDEFVMIEPRARTPSPSASRPAASQDQDGKPATDAHPSPRGSARPPPRAETRPRPPPSPMAPLVLFDYESEVTGPDPAGAYSRLLPAPLLDNPSVYPSVPRTVRIPRDLSSVTTASDASWRGESSGDDDDGADSIQSGETDASRAGAVHSLPDPDDDLASVRSDWSSYVDAAAADADADDEDVVLALDPLDDELDHWDWSRHSVDSTAPAWEHAIYAWPPPSDVSYSPADSSPWYPDTPSQLPSSPSRPSSPSQPSPPEKALACRTPGAWPASDYDDYEDDDDANPDIPFLDLGPPLVPLEGRELGAAARGFKKGLGRWLSGLVERVVWGLDELLLWEREYLGHCENIC